MTTRPILIISGTNRPGCNALRIANVLRDLYVKHSTPHEVFSLAELPAETFDPNTYATKPASIRGLQQRILDAAGLHIVTPEYNGSFPGVLKYFIDMLKFPESFESKPVAFVGESNGVWGALRAVEQLQGIFGYRNAHQYPPRVFIPAVATRFDGEGRFADADILQRLEAQCIGFAKFVGAVSA